MKTYMDPKVQMHPTRRGWLCIPSPGGGFVGWEGGGKPHINARHADGPLLCFSDGQLHWLTLWERVQFAFGWTDAEKLEKKRRPNLARGING